MDMVNTMISKLTVSPTSYFVLSKWNW